MATNRALYECPAPAQPGAHLDNVAVRVLGQQRLALLQQRQDRLQCEERGHV
jgi:hypothetical protein